MKEETVEEIKKEEIFNVNTNGRVRSQSENEMDISVSNLKQEEGGVKVEVKDIKVEENKTGGPSVKVESWEYFEEDDAESKYPAKKKKIVLMKAKPEILDEGGVESVEADTDMDTGKDTEEAAGEITQEDTEAKPDIGDEERESVSSVGDDSDSDIVTPDRYDRQAEEDAKYQDQLVIIIEDDDEEEINEVSFDLPISLSLWLPQVEVIHDMTGSAWAHGQPTSNMPPNNTHNSKSQRICGYIWGYCDTCVKRNKRL